MGRLSIVFNFVFLTAEKVIDVVVIRTSLLRG